MKIDPREWFETRKVDWMPVHFTRISIDNIDIFMHGEAEQWIQDNTIGRYAIVTCAVRQGNKLLSKVYAGFEESAEATYFTLSFLSKYRNYRNDTF